MAWKRVAAAVAGAILSAGTARAATCEVAAGPVVTAFTLCPGGAGVCTEGRIAAGPLAGATSFQATSLEQAGRVTRFGGVFTVTTADGAITYETTGILNAVTGRYVQHFTAIAGTGAYEGVTSHLSSTGFATATGFTGGVEGTVCTR
jgi:hypothetical protein